MIYLSMSGAKATMQRQEVLANNLANVATPGFRAELSAFRSVPVQGSGASTRVFTLESTPGYDATPGVVTSTGRNLDVAVEKTDLATWQSFMDLNLTHVFLCTKIIGGAMLERGWGRVINIASISGLIANRGIAGRHYETAKAAVIHFTRATAADWAPRGVTVNAICPGLFMTEPNQVWSKKHPEVIETFVKSVPMGRAGDPDEIGPLAVYLASPASSYVTGAAYVIDGGYTLW